MLFNEDKFVVLKYSTGVKLQELNHYGPNGMELGEKEQTKDLGVIISNDGRFQKHISQCVSSCQKIVGMIMRSFVTRDSKPMLVLFKALVISKMDYCSVLWTPCQLDMKRKLEKVQSNFTRRLNGMNKDGTSLDYWERLKALGLYSIERRHERYQIIYIWKIMVGLVDNPGITFYTSERRGKLAKIPALKMCGNLREQSFFVRGPMLFNAMSKEIRDFNEPSPLNCLQELDTTAWTKRFKRQIEDLFKTIPDEPNLSSEYSSMMKTQDIKGKKSNSVIDVLRNLNQT